jgi:hypothetical protein
VGSDSQAGGHGVEQVADLVERVRDQVGRGWCAVVFGGGDHGPTTSMARSHLIEFARDLLVMPEVCRLCS